MNKRASVLETVAEDVPVRKAVRCRRCRAELRMLYVDEAGRLWAVGLAGNVQISGYTCPHCERTFSWGGRKP